MNKVNPVITFPLVIAVTIALAIFLMRHFFEEKGIDTTVLFVANTILFIVHMGVGAYQKNALANKNPNVFIRSIMGGMMAKMVLMVLAILFYNMLAKSSFDKYAVFISLLFYLIYLGGEVLAISAINRRKNA